MPEKKKKVDRDASLKKALDEIESKKMTRQQRIEKMCETINKGPYGGAAKDAVTYLGSREVITLERFSSGSPEIDRALGGGWPRGRFIELYGPESGGKSTCCLHAIAERQTHLRGDSCHAPQMHTDGVRSTCRGQEGYGAKVFHPTHSPPSL